MKLQKGDWGCSWHFAAEAALPLLKRITLQ
jgi:hypothetical protein